jgi:purine-binding chemotaxis protein CheW
VRKFPEDGIKPPDASLSSYFDDLLGEGAFDFSNEPVQVVAPKDAYSEAYKESYQGARGLTESKPVSMAATLGRARVVALPTKKKSEDKPKRTLIRAESKSAPLSKADYAEPESTQSTEQKLKLEKLLQSARTQLLVESTALEKSATVVVPGLVTEVKARFVNDAEEIQDWDVEPIIEQIDAPIQKLISTGEVLRSDEPTQAAHFQMEGLEWLENGRPQWAQSRFDVLLFKVSGLTLAVPLISLGQIQPLTDELTPLFGQADWFMGLQPTAAGKIRTVNTAKFVMPERYDPVFLKTAKYVMSIDGVPWGLAVDSVNQPISLFPEDVKWRSDRSKRPWLAGTVKDHMCALLDIPRIGQLLVEADKNFLHN